MTTAQRIAARIQDLPEAAQQEVLDFIEFLRSRIALSQETEEERAWSAFSLAAAMHGMEEEPSPYTTADLVESFR